NGVQFRVISHTRSQEGEWMKGKFLCLLAFAVIMAGALAAQTSSGPQKGTLVITGGEFGKGVIEQFVTLAGGPEANFVYIPTASSGIKLDSGFIYYPPDGDAPAPNTRDFEKELCKMFGVKHITVLHTRNRNTADSESFVKPLKQANGVWLSQGNAGR